VRTAAVIGGGLAGGCVAWALGKRGVRVTLYDSEDTVCAKASGNMFGVVMPYLALKPSSLLTVYSAGYNYTQKLLRDTSILRDHFFQVGALQLPSLARFSELFTHSKAIPSERAIHGISSKEAGRLAGTTIHTDALYIPDAGFLQPSQFIAALLATVDPRVAIRCTSPVAKILQLSDGTWQLYRSDNEVLQSVDGVFVCTAFEASRFEQLSHLPLEPIRGQTSLVRSSGASSLLKKVVCYNGYVTPASKGVYLLGAHYRHHDLRGEVDDGDTCDVLARCSRWLPELQVRAEDVVSSRVCFRASTFDRLPYAGEVPFKGSFSDSSWLGRPSSSGLYASLGHGSRGLLSAPLSAEIAARKALEEDLGDLQDVAALLTPARIPLKP
jgi:tRNA 5-methylaminomethyl-2-thiouridine biosynthesis bifunctional protein